MEEEPVLKRLVGIGYTKVICLCDSNSAIKIFIGKIIFIENTPNLIVSPFS